jgi:hypothetical protein
VISTNKITQYLNHEVNSENIIKRIINKIILFFKGIDIENINNDEIILLKLITYDIKRLINCESWDYIMDIFDRYKLTKSYNNHDQKYTINIEYNFPENGNIELLIVYDINNKNNMLDSLLQLERQLTIRYPESTSFFNDGALSYIFSDNSDDDFYINEFVIHNFNANISGAKEEFEQLITNLSSKKLVNESKACNDFSHDLVDVTFIEDPMSLEIINLDVLKENPDSITVCLHYINNKILAKSFPNGERYDAWIEQQVREQKVPKDPETKKTVHYLENMSDTDAIYKHMSSKSTENNVYVLRGYNAIKFLNNQVIKYQI